jgi:hypothetical protein
MSGQLHSPAVAQTLAVVSLRLTLVMASSPMWANDQIQLVMARQLNNFRTSRSRDSSVGIVLGYGLDDQGSMVRFPTGAGNFSFHNRVQNGSGARPASYPWVLGAICLAVKRPGREADHSLPLSAEVNNAWSYTSTSPICLHGVVLS